MSTKITMEIDGQSFDVLAYENEFTRDYDKKGMPCSSNIKGNVRVTVELGSNPFFQEWITTRSYKDVKLSIYLADNDTALKKIRLSGAFVSDFQIQSNSEDAKPATSCITFSTDIYEENGITYNRNWHIGTLSPTGYTTPTPANQGINKPSFIKQHLEDLNHKEITQKEIAINQEFLVVLETRHAKGKRVDIDLQDDSKDFEYQGKHMEKDIIKNVPIQGNITKVQLKAITQTNN